MSHLLFIYLSHLLLAEVVDWSRFFKGQAENHRKNQILVLFFAIGLGYLVSTFFLDLLLISRSFADALMIP